MKFTCYHRGNDGSRQRLEIQANDRRDAFFQAKKRNLDVIEMLQGSGYARCYKIPNEDELNLLRVRRSAYWIGFASSFFSPILWIAACIIAVCKYDMRGLACCITGIISPGLPVILGLLGLFFGGGSAIGCILGTAAFGLGVWLARYFYKKDVLLGFTMPTETENDRL